MKQVTVNGLIINIVESPFVKDGTIIMMSPNDLTLDLNTKTFKYDEKRVAIIVNIDEIKEQL